MNLYDWNNGLPEKLFVVAELYCVDQDIVACWTLSGDPTVPGWCTDSGIGGYGLPKAVAEVIAAKYNKED